MGTLNNIKTKGSINALTGPIARGDTQIVARHIFDIDKRLPHFSKLYKLLGKYTLDLADIRGEVNKEASQKLAKLFKS